jgi:flagellar basal body-associated protein FliL
MNIDLSRFTQGLLPDWGALSLEEVIATKGVELINFFIGFAAFIAVVMLVVGGYLFITSTGDPEKTEKAQKAITAAVVGLIIVFIARAIVFFVVDLGSL